MKKAERVLIKTKALWEPLLDDFKNYWTQMVEQRDVISDIAEIYHIHLTKPGEEKSFVPVSKADFHEQTEF